MKPTKADVVNFPRLQPQPHHDELERGTRQDTSSTSADHFSEIPRLTPLAFSLSPLSSQKSAHLQGVALEHEIEGRHHDRLAGTLTAHLAR